MQQEATTTETTDNVQAVLPTTENTNEVDAASQTEEQKTQEKKDNAKTLKDVKALSEDFDDHIVTIKIDGQEKQMTVRDMKKLQSLEQASQQRFQKAQEITKKAQDFWERMQDPDEFFKYKKMNPVEYAEAKLRAAVEEAEMSPEQKAAREREQELTTKEKEIMRFYQEQAQKEIDQGIGQAFQKAGLPKSPFLVSKIAALVSQSIDRSKSDGSEPLSYEQAADKVKVWFQNGIKETLTHLPEDQLMKYLGSEIVEKLRKMMLAQVQSAPASVNSPAKAVSAEQNKLKPKQKVVARTWREFHDMIDKL